jgi:hypothetical protein
MADANLADAGVVTHRLACAAELRLWPGGFDAGIFELLRVADQCGDFEQLLAEGIVLLGSVIENGELKVDVVGDVESRVGDDVDDRREERVKHVFEWPVGQLRVRDRRHHEVHILVLILGVLARTLFDLHSHDSCTAGGVHIFEEVLLRAEALKGLWRRLHIN